MAKKSFFAKKFPPIFIAGAVIGALVVAYKYIFADRANKRNTQQPTAQNLPEVEMKNHQDTPPVAQIEHKNGES